jgi:MtN3 and saliva related transmembrane protein
MSPFWITTVGIIAAIGTTAAWFPQTMRTWRTRSARDFSWGYLTLFSTGVAGWLLYGILRDDPVIIGANSITLLLVLTVAFVKFRAHEA